MQINWSLFRKSRPFFVHCRLIWHEENDDNLIKCRSLEKMPEWPCTICTEPLAQAELSACPCILLLNYSLEMPCTWLYLLSYDTFTTSGIIFEIVRDLYRIVLIYSFLFSFINMSKVDTFIIIIGKWDLRLKNIKPSLI